MRIVSRCFALACLVVSRCFALACLVLSQCFGLSCPCPVPGLSSTAPSPNLSPPSNQWVLIAASFDENEILLRVISAQGDLVSSTAFLGPQSVAFTSTASLEIGRGNPTINGDPDGGTHYLRVSWRQHIYMGII